MIKNNKFYLNNLETIVFLGYKPIHENLIKINKKLKIKSVVITAKKKVISNNDIRYYNKSKPDKSFEKLIISNCDPKNTLFISLSSRWLFKKDLIDNLFKKNIINFHNARLPMDAGGGGYSWRIMRNDRICHFLAHVIDTQIDTGPIVAEQSLVFPSECRTPLDFENYENQNFLNFYENIIKKLKSQKSFSLSNQQKSLRRYNPRINTKVNGWINWDTSSYDLVNFINAFDEPYMGASTFIKNKQRVYIKKVQLHGGEVQNHPFMSGLIFRHEKKWIVVSSPDQNSIIVEKVLDKNGKNIIHDLKEGDRFYTTPEQKFLSRSKRVRYRI
ncbi:hypothetical protein N9K34_03865 [Candidatus Pelagibacter bacterium]|nr:hypothetical protein [Candidatus Pelagibacter bacterium]